MSCEYPQPSVRWSRLLLCKTLLCREESRLLLCKTPPIDAERKQLSPNSCAPSIPLSLSVGHTKNLTIDAFFSAFFIHPGFRCGLLYWGHFAIQAYFQSLHSFCIWILEAKLKYPTPRIALFVRLFVSDIFTLPVRCSMLIHLLHLLVR